MPDLWHLIQSAPTAIRLADAVKRASRGDEESLSYLKNEGWWQALDVVQPGAGGIGQQILHHATDAYEAITQALGGDVIEGQFRVLPNMPWENFVKRLIGSKFGGHIIMGPMGSGKTTLAARLAQRIMQEQRYKVECINMYGNDVPNFAVTISTETLVKRMGQLKAFLALQTELDDDEREALEETDDKSKKHKPKYPATMPPTGRVIIIDEASLGLTSNPNDPARRSALQALAQCRHLNWHVLFLAQWAGQLPLQLLGQSTVWVKRPDGREQNTDRDNRAVRDLWQRAEDAYATLKESPWWRDCPNEKAWTFCDCRALDGKAGYTGLIPVSKPDEFTEAEFIEVDE